MAPLPYCLGGRFWSPPPPLLLLLLLLSLSRVRGQIPPGATISGGTTSKITRPATVLTTGGGGGGGGDAGDGGAEGGAGDEALDPGYGSASGSEIDHGAQDSGSTAIIIGCLVGLLVLAVAAVAVWKYRSRMKTGEPEAPTSPGEFNQSVTNIGLEPTGSNLA